MALGLVLLLGSKGAQFLMGEVSLYGIYMTEKARFLPGLPGKISYNFLSCFPTALNVVGAQGRTPFSSLLLSSLESSDTKVCAPWIRARLGSRDVSNRLQGKSPQDVLSCSLTALNMVGAHDLIPPQGLSSSLLLSSLELSDTTIYEP